MNKQLEYYKELDEWFDNNAIEREFILQDQFVFKDRVVYEKLLELAQQLESKDKELGSLKRQLLEYEESELEAGFLESDLELKSQQLEQENKELKVVVSEVLRIAQYPPMDVAIVNAIGKDRNGLLAQHDKEVVVKAVDGLIKKVGPVNGYNAIDVLDIMRSHLEQLKEGE